MTGKVNIGRTGRTKVNKSVALATLLMLAGLSPVTAGQGAPTPPGIPPESDGPTCVLNKKAPDCAAAAAEVHTLRVGTVIGDAIAGGQTHFFAVTLSPGQSLQTRTEQQGVDLSLAVCAPDGTLLAEVDRQNGSWGPEAVTVLARDEGVYRLQVSPVSSTGSGRYEVRVGWLRSADPTDAIRVEAERLVAEGGRYFDKGKPACLRESIKRFEQALKLWRLLGEPYEEAITQYGLGWSLSDLGSHGMAKFPAPLYRISWSYESREEHLSALQHFKEAYSIMQALGDRHGQAIMLAGMAWPNLYLGQHDEAMRNFSEARQHFRAKGNKRGEAITTNGLGWVHANLNENEQALDCFLRAQQLRQEVGDRKGEAITLLGVGRMYGRLGLHQEAFDNGRSALTLFAKQKDAHGKASALTIMGWALKGMGRLTEAHDSFREAYEAHEGDRTGMATALYGKAHLQAEQGNLAGALSTMQEVFRLVEPLRERGASSDLRTYYFSNLQEYYEFYIELLMRRHRLDPTAGYADEALWASERARARELMALLAGVDDVRQRGYDSELAQPLKVDGVKALLDDDTLLLEYFLGAERSYLWLVSPQGAQSFELPKRAEIEAAALELYRLISGRDAGKAKAGDAVAGRQAAVADEQAQRLGIRLGQTLLGPVASRLGNKRLVFVAQGILQIVPFAALSLPGGAYKPLVVDHEIVSLPSSSVLRALRRSPRRHQRAHKALAVVADPVFTADDSRVRQSLAKAATGAQVGGGGPHGTPPVAAGADVGGGSRDNQFHRLPGTRWEAQQLASLVPKEGLFLALDFDASRETILSEDLSQYRIIHFATHAVVDDSNPARSKVVLTQIDEQGRRRDGDLTFTDVYKMNLQAELIVLNGCQTGLGPDIRGEGMIGLMGGFMRAGAPRVLVSLWSISDRAAAELMVRVYRKMLGKRGLSPAAALREAQIEAWQDPRWKSPYYWAAFTVQGEWRWVPAAPPLQ